MSLRTQIQGAIDEVAPPAPDLGRRVAAFALADQRDRRILPPRRRVGRSTRLRAPMTFVAAAVVVALLGGLVLAGRVWRDLNATPATINAVELKDLEKKPLLLPSVAPGSECPGSLEHLDHQLGMVIGDGPVYVIDGGSLDTTDWGKFGHLALYYDAKAPGLVLVRAKDLLQPDIEVAFAQYPLAPSRVTVVGPVVGQVHAVNHDLRLRSEAVFQDPWSTPSVGKYGPQYLVLVAMPKGSSECIGFQVDGPDFSENFVVAPGYLTYL